MPGAPETSSECVTSAVVPVVANAKPGEGRWYIQAGQGGRAGGRGVQADRGVYMAGATAGHEGQSAGQLGCAGRGGQCAEGRVLMGRAARGVEGTRAAAGNHARTGSCCTGSAGVSLARRRRRRPSRRSFCCTLLRQPSQRNSHAPYALLQPLRRRVREGEAQVRAPAVAKL